MIYRILALLVLSSVVARCAVGDLIGLEVQDHGSRIWATVSGLNTNGNFYNGFGTNNSITGTQKLTLTISSHGYLSSGATTTVSTVAYGTKIVRAAYPMHTTNNILPEASNAKASIWISEYVFASDSLIASGETGWYAVTNGTGTNANSFSGATVTNSSVQLYQKVIGNWSPRVPRYHRLGSSVRLSAIGFHHSGKDGKPLALCRFVTTGLTSGIKQTNDATSMTVDVAFNSLSPHWNTYTNIGNVNPAEYHADVDLSAFTDQENLRHDFVMFPIRGTSGSVLDTTLDEYPHGGSLPTWIQNKYDPNNTHSRVIAVVDNVNGNDTNGRSATNTTPDTISSAIYFATVGQAMINGAASNNTFYGHNDTSGIIIYVRTATTNYPGLSMSGAALTVPDVAPIVRIYPGDTAPVITHRIAASASAHMKRTRIDGLSFAIASSEIPWSAYSHLSFENCPSITSVSTGPMANCTNIYIIQSSIGSFAQGLRPSSGNSTDFSLHGCDLNNFNQAFVPRVAIGNVHPNTAGNSYTINSELSSVPLKEFVISYNNYWGGSSNAANHFNLANIHELKIGMAIVQDVYEKCRAGEPAGSIASGSTFTNATNVIFWGNLVDGGRIADLGSSNSETTSKWRKHFSMIGNIWAYRGQKADFDTTANANRIANWDILNMVAARGNFYIRSTVTTAALDFQPEFAGMWTYQPNYTNVANFPLFIYRAASSVGLSTLGQGNYRVQVNSPENMLLKFNSPLPYDILGVARGDRSIPGPYSEAAAHRGL